MTKKQAAVLTKIITQEIFGSPDVADPINRIQFMRGDWPHRERPCGGLCRVSFQSDVANIIWRLSPDAK